MGSETYMDYCRYISRNKEKAKICKEIMMFKSKLYVFVMSFYLLERASTSPKQNPRNEGKFSCERRGGGRMIGRSLIVINKFAFIHKHSFSFIDE